jgi:hypothetical protein
MNIRIIGIVFLFAFFSCSPWSNENSEVIKSVTIIAENDEIIMNDTYRAKLYFAYKDSIHPSFFLITKQDTDRLYFDYELGYVSFQWKSSLIGKRVFKGFVEYTINGQVVKEPFEIKYTVKP